MEGDNQVGEGITRRWPDRPGDWPTGPWDDEPDERIWVDPATGLTCHIMRHDWGFLCGYVIIPEGHPLHGDKSRTRGILSAHGDLNYADFARIETMDGDQWHAGFDCGHAGDRYPYMILQYRRSGIQNLIRGTYRDWAFVQTECEYLARQVIGIVNLMRPATGATAAQASRPTHSKKQPTAATPTGPPSPDHPAE